MPLKRVFFAFNHNYPGCMPTCIFACGHAFFKNPQKLTSQHHLNTWLWSLITCEHAAKSWGSTTSISLSYRLAKSKAPTLASLQIAEWRSTTRTARSTVRRPPPPPTTTTRTRNRTRRDTSRPTTRLFCGCRCRWSRWRGAPTLSP